MKKKQELNFMNDLNKLNLVHTLSRNKKSFNLDEKYKSNTVFSTISTKEELINPNINQGISLFLNKTIRFDDVIKSDREKKKRVSPSELLQKNIYKTYYSNKNKNEEMKKIEIRVKAPKDNKNSPFFKQTELLKSLSIQKQIMKRKFLEESKYFIF